jgi:hypothetical protein
MTHQHLTNASSNCLFDSTSSLNRDSMTSPDGQPTTTLLPWMNTALATGRNRFGKKMAFSFLYRIHLLSESMLRGAQSGGGSGMLVEGSPRNSGPVSISTQFSSAAAPESMPHRGSHAS